MCARYQLKRAAEKLIVKLYVGNLPWSVDDTELSNMFSEFGEVHSASVVNDRESGRSRGFGFVEMDQASGTQAVNALNGKDFQSRALRVNEAESKPRSARA